MLAQNVSSTARQLGAFSVARAVMQYAGTTTGYGFFAPEVGSSFLLEATALDEHGEVLLTATHPALQSTHSMLRFHSLLNRMQHLLPEEHGRPNALRQRMTRAIAHCVSQQLMAQLLESSYRTIRCNVYLYVHTALLNHSSSPHGHRILIYQKELPYFPAKP